MSGTSTIEEKVKPIPVEIQKDGTAIATFIDEQQDQQRDAEHGGDQRLGRDTEDEDDKGSAGGGDTETERSRSARRRERARRARNERENEIEQLRAGFATQQQLLDTMFVAQGQQSLQMLENEAEKAKAAYAEAERRKAAAIEKGDGAGVTEADRVMANATTYYNNVALQHTNVVRRLQAAKPEPQQQDGRIKITARGERVRDDFLADHPFIDLDKNNDTTAAIKTIDARVAAEGYDPNTRDYWDEVSDRLKETMPHLFKGGSVREQPAERRRETRREDDDGDVEDRRERRRGGPPLGDAGRDRQPRANDIRLDARMVDALDQAGIPLTGGTSDQIKRRNTIIQSWGATRPK